MKRYKKAPGAGVVVLAGYGRIEEGRILHGDDLQQYVPQLLVEVPSAPAEMPMESRPVKRGPAVLTEPVDSPAVSIPEAAPSILEEETPIPDLAPPVKKPRKKKDPADGA